VTLYQYDTLGNLTCAVQKGTDTTAFTTCAAAPTTWRPRSFTYDMLSRLLNATNPESGTITYTYDNNGNVASKVSPKPNPGNTGTITTNYAYDALNRLLDKTYVGGITTTAAKYAYDGGTLSCPGPSALAITSPTNLKGHRTAMCSSSSASSWSYDPMGRPLVERINHTNSNVNKTLTYSYNFDGSLKTLTYPSGDVVTYTTSGAGRATNVSDASNNYVAPPSTAPMYTAAGLLVGMKNGTAISTVNGYNSRLQPVTLSAGITSATLMSISYNFHAGNGDNGNVFQIINNLDSTRSTAFQYDPLNRIQQANTITTTGANCWGEVYTIDNWGNLTNRAGVSGMTGCSTEGLSLAASVKNQLSGLTYDLAGNVTNDGNGNMPVYDSENRMVSDAGVTSSYDADGRRMEKSSGTLYWYGSSGEVLAESNLSGTINEEYIFFSGERIARVDRPSGTVHYYFSDNLGSSSVITDAVGTVQEQYFYYPYGGMVAQIGSDSNHYKFTAKERDSESGLDNFGARYYGSTVGRFMVPDWADKPTDVPYANFGNPQSLNLYSYVNNNPTTTRDPDGHCIEDACVAEVAVVVAVIESPEGQEAIEEAEGAAAQILPAAEQVAGNGWNFIKGVAAAGAALLSSPSGDKTPGPPTPKPSANANEKTKDEPEPEPEPEAASGGARKGGGAEHTRGARRSTYNRHTGTRSGDRKPPGYKSDRDFQKSKEQKKQEAERRKAEKDRKKKWKKKDESGG
jgi:RHS repeat-associated protein